MHRTLKIILVLLALLPIFGLADPCDLPTGLGSWASIYGASPAGDIVITRAVLVDVASITANGITLSAGGKLYFDSSKPSISLSATFILVSGTGASLNIGSEACPYTKQVTITLRGEAVADPMFGANFLGVGPGGTLELHGAKGLLKSWTKLNRTAAIGATSIQVLDNTMNWQAGDKIVITTTDYSPLQSEVVTITSVSGYMVSFTPALQWSHYGQVTCNVDQRGEVGLLTRNILIQGFNRGTYFGGHMMIANGFSQVHIEGVEFNNMGQDQIARYPIHFHMCGVVPVGTYIKYNSIHDSNFRCVTIHGTNGVLIQGNVAYKNYGHCYFLEDGIEQNNIFNGNLAVLTMPKDFGQHLGSDMSNSGLSSYWISNPQNTFENNVAAGSYTAGFWYITNLGARGLSACLPQYQNLPYKVSNLLLQSFKGNTAHSCAFGLGIESTAWNIRDSPAQTCDTSVANWEPRNADGSIPWTVFDSFTAHHIRDRGVWARMPNIVVNNGRFADNYESIEYATSGDMPPYASQQLVINSIIVGFSDNKGNQNGDPTTQYQFWDTNLLSTVPSLTQPVNGIKIYDGPQVLINTVFTNFPSVNGRPMDSAIGARLADQSQVATTNYVQGLQFINVAVKVAVLDNTMDGGRTGNFRDVDGSVTGYSGSTVLRNNPFYSTSGCKASSAYMMTCPHKYTQLWVLDMTANGANNDMIISRGDQPTISLPFDGFLSGPMWRYQPIVSIGQNYIIRFQNRVTNSLVLQLNNADMSDRVGLAVCYPPGTIISSVLSGYANYPGNPYPANVPSSQIKPLPASSVNIGTSSSYYYYDNSRSILYVNLQQRNTRSDYGNFCPTAGCDFLWINAQFTGSSAAVDCTAYAYAPTLLTAASSTLTNWLNLGLVATTSSFGSVLNSLTSGTQISIPALGSGPVFNPVFSVAPPLASATSRPTSTTTTTANQSTAAPVTTSAPSSSSSTAPTVSSTAPTVSSTAPTTTTTTPPASSTPCTTACGAGLSCCGPACYPPDQYQCTNGRLYPVTAPPNVCTTTCPASLSCCGDACYTPTSYTCTNAMLCPVGQTCA